MKCDQLDGQEIIHLGYRLGYNYWGQGIASECAQAVIAFSKAQAITPVYALIEPKHAASIAVAKKVGFTPQSTVNFYNRQLTLYGLSAAPNE